MRATWSAQLTLINLTTLIISSEAYDVLFNWKKFCEAFMISLSLQLLKSVAYREL
jgi:hypothetical protein